MPIYEFKCSQCEIISEFIMSIKDQNPKTCPSCGEKGGLKKLISKNNFVLKGQGWYETDFKNSGNNVTKKETSASKSSSSAKTEPEKKSLKTPSKSDSSKKAS